MSQATSTPPISLTPEEGWHCTHAFYRFRRSALNGMSQNARAEGRQRFVELLSAGDPQRPCRLQTSLAAGHKADFGIMALDPCPLKIQGLHHALLASPLGAALEAVYSFVSLTEVSEYVPTVEQYAQRLLAEGELQGSPAYVAKLKAYEQREAAMRAQRLHPDIPPWPATCFYPMNKKREVGENWFLLDFARRNELMAEHGRTGMIFAGKVTQLITVGIGLEDWEWGVTLWARNPQFLKEIVYRMRFDEASARYAVFGPFYTSYVMTPAEILDRCCV